MEKCAYMLLLAETFERIGFTMQNNNESSIKFRELFYLFVSKLWIMILVAVIVGGSLFAFNYITYEPLYKSTGSIYILRQDSDVDKGSDYNSDFNLALSVVSDCTKLLTSRTVLNQVIDECSLTCTYNELNSMISITNPSNTRYLEISVLSDDPEKSKMIVDSICEIGKDQIVDLMGFNQVNVVDEGTLASVPSNSKFSYTTLLASLVAFLLTYIVFALVYIFDDKISDPDMLEKQLGLSVLALIPNMDKERPVSKKDVYYGRAGAQRHRYYAKHGRGNR